ncbi:MAG: hypothetical protein IRY87_07090 [Acetobacteraceae bacterium]|nr:hypothetical protein [Acetobacteraceae bacterium]
MDPMVLKALLDQAREEAAQIADEHGAFAAARAIRARKEQPATGCGSLRPPGSNPGSPLARRH